MTQAAVAEPADSVEQPPAHPYRSLARERDFLLLLAAGLASRSADFFSYVALSWVTLDLTHSGAAVAGVIGLQTLTWVGVLLFGGALADRETPRRLMLHASLGRLLLTALLAALIAGHLFNRWELAPAAVGLGLVGGLFMPGRQSALPGLVPGRLLEAANGLLQVSSQLAVVLGPALAGVLVARSGSAVAFAVDAAGYALAALLVWLIAARPAGATAAGKPRGKLTEQIVEGLRAVWNDVALRAVVIALAVVNFCGAGPLDVGLTVRARFAWGGAWSLGLVLAGFGLGAAAGGLATGALRRRPPVGLTLVGACVWLAAGLGSFGVLGLAPAFADAVLCGLAIGFFNVIAISWLQRRTPAERIGRVMALVSLASLALSPLSYAIAAPLVAASPALLFAGAGGLLLLTGAGLLASRSVRTA
jgi:MFS transporter